VHNIYVKSERRVQARKQFRAVISDGGNGGSGSAYAAYIQQFKLGHKEGGIRSIYGLTRNSIKGTTNTKAEVDIVSDDDDVNGIVIEEEKPEKRYAFNAMVVVDFMDGVIPNRNLFKERTGNFLNAIVLNHDYLKSLSGATMNFPRTCRFLGFVIIVLSEIFADTLFFGIFYPSDGSCNVLTSEVRYFRYKVKNIFDIISNSMSILYHRLYGNISIYVS
jgi:hypothetical protein